MPSPPVHSATAAVAAALNDTTSALPGHDETGGDSETYTGFRRTAPLTKAYQETKLAPRPVMQLVCLT